MNTISPWHTDVNSYKVLSTYCVHIKEIHPFVRLVNVDIWIYVYTEREREEREREREVEFGDLLSSHGLVMV